MEEKRKPPVLISLSEQYEVYADYILNIKNPLLYDSIAKKWDISKYRAKEIIKCLNAGFSKIELYRKWLKTDRKANSENFENKFAKEKGYSSYEFFILVNENKRNKVRLRENLGLVLRKFRKTTNLTIDSLAWEYYLSKSSLESYINARCLPPSLESVEDLFEAINNKFNQNFRYLDDFLEIDLDIFPLDDRFPKLAFKKIEKKNVFKEITPKLTVGSYLLKIRDAKKLTNKDLIKRDKRLKAAKLDLIFSHNFHDLTFFLPWICETLEISQDKVENLMKNKILV